MYDPRPAFALFCGAPRKPPTERFHSTWSATSTFTTGATAVGAEEIEVPESFVLSQNYPNPFNPSTTISFSIDETEHIRLAVYDILGREMAVLVDAVTPVGQNKVRFDAGNLSSGMYLYRLVSGSRAVSRKMMLFK